MYRYLNLVPKPGKDYGYLNKVSITNSSKNPVFSVINEKGANFIKNSPAGKRIRKGKLDSKGCYGCVNFNFCSIFIL